MIFSLALFPAIDGALLRHPPNRTPKAAQQELYKEPAVHINVHYHLPSMQTNTKVQSLPWPQFAWKYRFDVCGLVRRPVLNKKQKRKKKQTWRPLWMQKGEKKIYTPQKDDSSFRTLGGIFCAWKLISFPC